MKITTTALKDCFLVEPTVFGDQRGHFFEGFNKAKLEELAGVSFEPKQLNQSKSSHGVLRGLHFQKNPKAQAKLVSCTQGQILDVAVDLRTNSESFGKHVAVILSEDNKRSLFIPKGMAHGFVVLSETAKLMYLVDEVYSPEHDSGIIYNDPDLNINWEMSNSKVILSDKDKALPSLIDINLDF